MRRPFTPLLAPALVAGCMDPQPMDGPDLASASDQAGVRRTLRPDLAWRGMNRERLDAMIASVGIASPAYDAAKRPVAALDWDNTVVKNDAGDATLFYMIKAGKVLQPPGKNWRLTSPYLTADAVTALKAACDTAAEAGQPLPTGTNAACATEIASIYAAAVTTGAKAAFAGWNYRRMEPAYAWAAHLLGGYSPDEVRAIATAARSESLAAAQGATQTLGTYPPVTAWVRYYDQIKDLIGTLQASGFDVWIVSASPQGVIEEWAGEVGVAKDHVIGIRSLVQGGRLGYNLQGCGDVPDGTNDGAGAFTGNSMITYIEGKRCWINKAIYGDATATAMNRRDAARRQVFGAGDSDTDIELLKDATKLKLVINRNKKELMCNAYGNAGGTWIVNPMFIEPKGQMMGAYPCSTSACKDAAGKSVACKDEDDKIIPDQMDTVFGPA